LQSMRCMPSDEQIKIVFCESCHAKFRPFWITSTSDDTEAILLGAKENPEFCEPILKSKDWSEAMRTRQELLDAGIPPYLDEKFILGYEDIK
jgi:hypothetical protein